MDSPRFLLQVAADCLRRLPVPAASDNQTRILLRALGDRDCTTGLESQRAETAAGAEQSTNAAASGTIPRGSGTADGAVS